jgi:hypothetical protein
MKVYFEKLHKYLIKDTKHQIMESIKISNKSVTFPYLFLGTLFVYCYISGPVVQHYNNRKYIQNKEKEYFSK